MIYYEDINDSFRKGLIVYLPRPKRSNPHWYVFLTDLMSYIDKTSILSKEPNSWK